MNKFYLLLAMVFGLSGSCTYIPGTDRKNGNIEDSDSLMADTIPLKSNMAEYRVDMTQFMKIVLNVPYTTDGLNTGQILDIIYPEETIGPYKVILLVHGGGWWSGDKQSESLAPLFEAINQGYAVVSVNYRLSGAAKWPAQLYDVKSAIRFLRANSDMYRLDTQEMVVWGIAEGAHLALMAAATNENPGYEDLNEGNEEFSSKIDGVISWYGIADLALLPENQQATVNRLLGIPIAQSPEQGKKASPLYHVTNNFPPVLLVHGTEDNTIPYQQSVLMLHEVNLKTGDLRAELVTFEGGQHADPLIHSSVNMLNNLDFADKIYYTEVNPYRTTVVKDIKLDFDIKEE